MELVVLVLVVIAVAVAVDRYRAHRRSAEARAWAHRQGWEYVGDGDDYLYRWRGAPFDQGSRGRAHDLMTGTVGDHVVVAFSFSYVVGGGRFALPREEQIIAVLLPVRLPHLDLLPRTSMDKVARAFGRRDIRIGVEPFDAEWRVTSPQPRFAKEMIHPGTVSWLMRPSGFGRGFRFVGDALMSWDSGPP